MQWRMLTCPLPTIAVGDDRQSEYDHAVTNTDLPSFYNRCPGEWWCQSEHDNAARMCQKYLSTKHAQCTCAYAQCTLNSSKKGPARRGFCTKGFLHEGLSDASEVVVRRHSSKAFLAIGFALARNRRQCAVFGSTKRNSQVPNLIHIVFCVFFCFL